MNVFSLGTKTLKLCKLGVDDATIRQEYAEFFLDAYNAAYERVMREKWQVWTTEAVALDANKCFTVSSLSKRFEKIREVLQHPDFDSATNFSKPISYEFCEKDGDGTIVVPGSEASSTVYVEYQYVPERLAVSYHISGANTLKVIPVSEAISASEATALVGKIIHVIDVSLGTTRDYTIASATSGAAGACTITVIETISTAVASADEIYIGEAWEPQFPEYHHDVLCYWAVHEYYMSKGANYGGYAIGYWDQQKFVPAFNRIRRDYGAPTELKGFYSPL